MEKYRKRPVVIEAIQFVSDDSDVIAKICKFSENTVSINYNDPDNPVMYIHTLEGIMQANVGDYIIKGVNGEVYPCKPDIFQETYTEDKGSGEVSDGYHTFNELYHHRMVLFSVICNQNKEKAWKSKLHDDGTMYDNYFIVGITTVEGDYTYHYHMDHWNEFDVKELEYAPKWDGHTPSDITRLVTLTKD